MARTILRYTNSNTNDETICTIPENSEFAQIVDMRVLLDSYYTDDEVDFGLYVYAMLDGNKIAVFYPENYIITNHRTSFYVCFDEYIQLPAGAELRCKLTKPNVNANIELNTSIEYYS